MINHFVKCDCYLFTCNFYWFFCVCVSFIMFTNCGFEVNICIFVTHFTDGSKTINNRAQPSIYLYRDRQNLVKGKGSLFFHKYLFSNVTYILN